MLLPSLSRISSTLGHTFFSTHAPSLQGQLLRVAHHAAHLSIVQEATGQAEHYGQQQTSAHDCQPPQLLQGWQAPHTQLHHQLSRSYSSRARWRHSTRKGATQSMDPLSFRGGHDLMNLSLNKRNAPSSLQVPGLEGRLAQVMPQQLNNQRADAEEQQQLEDSLAVPDGSTALSSIDRPVMSQSQPLVDTVRVTVQGGRGGDGCTAFFKQNRGRRRIPCGGDGGRGGDVVLRASQGEASLEGIPTVITAQSGGPGGPNTKAGRNGGTQVILVPVGTVVHTLHEAAQQEHLRSSSDDSDSDMAETQHTGGSSRQHRHPQAAAGTTRIEAQAARASNDTEQTPIQSQGVVPQAGQQEVEDDWEVGEYEDEAEGEDTDWSEQLLAELLEDGQQVVVARGGAGGRGNASIQPNRRLDPKGDWVMPSELSGTAGGPGSVGELRLELKVLADVGMVGMPNAGKSSLLSALTAARAKVGSYAFTTIRPQLGAIIYTREGSAAAAAEPDEQLFGGGPSPSQLPSRLILADIPGLIAGAHANRGRGNEFLRHVERVRVITYVVDLSGGEPGSLTKVPAAEQLHTLQRELELYRSDLALLPAVIAANKVDACLDARSALHALKSATPHVIIPVSAVTGAGLDRLKMALRVVAHHAAGKPRHATSQREEV